MKFAYSYILILSFGVLSAQKFFDIKATVDTVLDAPHFRSKCCVCGDSSFPAFFNIKYYNDQMHEVGYSDQVDNVEDNSNKTTKTEIVPKGKVNFLYHWADDFLIICAYKQKISNFNNNENFYFIKVGQILGDLHSYLDTMSAYEKSKLIPYPMGNQIFKPFEILAFKGVKNSGSDHFDDTNLTDEESTGLYLAIPTNRQSRETIFLKKRNGEIQFISPVKYWIFKSQSFKRDSKTFSDISAQKNLKYTGRYYILHATGMGDTSMLDKQWKSLFDHNVFGHFRCLDTSFFVPSPAKYDAFNHPFSEKLNNNTSGSEDVYHILLPSSNKKIRLVRQEKLNCTSIFDLNPINGSVNNLRYLPNVYFLPDYFKVESINGLNQEDFIKEQCKN